MACSRLEGGAIRVVCLELVRSESACGLDKHTLFWHVQNTIFSRHCAGSHWVFVDVELNGMVGSSSFGVEFEQERQVTRDEYSALGQLTPEFAFLPSFHSLLITQRVLTAKVSCFSLVYAIAMHATELKEESKCYHLVYRISSLMIRHIYAFNVVFVFLGSNNREPLGPIFSLNPASRV
jgi:hypothetical protein